MADFTTGASEYGEQAAASTDDVGLVARAKAGDTSAWQEIYEAYYTKIFRYMQARLGQRETAEDLGATVFVEALKAIRSYHERGHPFLAWLYTIARNIANDYYRKSARWPAEPLIEAEAIGGDPATLIDGWDLRAAITRLSKDQREAILLRFFVGLTTPE